MILQLKKRKALKCEQVPPTFLAFLKALEVERLPKPSSPFPLFQCIEKLKAKKRIYLPQIFLLIAGSINIFMPDLIWI